MSPAVADYTVSEQILLAAHQLDRDGKTPFTAEHLIVTSWKQFPRTFGLKGYEDKYPDSNKVLSSIMGERGLARRGWLAKMGQKLYALTREGRRNAAKLLNEELEPAASEYIELDREKELFLLRLLGTSAYRKFEENQKSELAFADACRFWDLTQNLKGEAVDDRLKMVEVTLNELEQDLAQDDARLSNGRMISAGDVRVLRNIHRYMEDRFDRLLNLLRSRNPKR